jgi:hypothetical protein
MSSNCPPYDPTEEEQEEAQAIMDNKYTTDHKTLEVSVDVPRNDGSVQTPTYTLSIDKAGVVRVLSVPGVGNLEDTVAMFDISQITDDGLREQAFEFVDPEIRWARFNAYPEEWSSFVDFSVTDDITDDLDKTYKFSEEQPSHRDKVRDAAKQVGIDIGSDNTERELYDALSQLSEGDLVRFGGGISPKEVHSIDDIEGNSIYVNFFDPESEPTDEQMSSAISDIFISYQGEDEPLDGANRELGNWAFGDGETHTVAGIPTGVSISEYDGDDHDAALVADVEWQVLPVEITE